MYLYKSISLLSVPFLLWHHKNSTHSWELTLNILHYFKNWSLWNWDSLQQVNVQFLEFEWLFFFNVRSMLFTMQLFLPSLGFDGRRQETSWSSPHFSNARAMSYSPNIIRFVVFRRASKILHEPHLDVKHKSLLPALSNDFLLGIYVRSIP